MPHVKLYFGSPSSDKEERARASALEYLQGNPHNLFEYFPEGKSAIHSIASIKQLIQEAMTLPFEAQYKVMIIHGAERMLPSGANALLKTLEEPLESTVLLLLTNDLDAILPTIRSRSLLIPCLGVKKSPPLSLEAIEKLKETHPYQWVMEVDRLIEQIFETHQEVPGISRQIEKVREALFCHMKLKSALELLSLPEVY